MSKASPFGTSRQQPPSAFASTFHPRRDQTLRIMNGAATSAPAAPHAREAKSNDLPPVSWTGLC
jgi:hypothetical protein